MKNLLLGLAVIIPAQLFAADDSVYSWGAWAEGIKPAAGPVANITPAPAQKPQVNFRPNENSAFARNFVAVVTPPVGDPTPGTPPVVISPPTPVVQPTDVVPTGDPRSRGR